MSNRLFTDDNRDFTIYGLSYKNKESAIKSIEKIDRVLDTIASSIELNTCSPSFIRPVYHIHTRNQLDKYILIQKMYRVLALNNRAKVLYNRTGNNNIKAAIDIFSLWLKQYKNLILKLKQVQLIKCNNHNE